VTPPSPFPAIAPATTPTPFAFDDNFGGGFFDQQPSNHLNLPQAYSANSSQHTSPRTSPSVSPSPSPIGMFASVIPPAQRTPSPTPFAPSSPSSRVPSSPSHSISNGSRTPSPSPVANPMMRSASPSPASSGFEGLYAANGSSAGQTQSSTVMAFDHVHSRSTEDLAGVRRGRIQNNSTPPTPSSNKEKVSLDDMLAASLKKL
jgi:hypothetical protein